MYVAFTAYLGKENLMRKIAILGMLAAFGTSQAALLFDQGPTTGAYSGCWSNYTESQNFADQVTLATTSNVTRINYFSCFDAFDGTSWHVKILADDGAGNPGAYLAEWDQTYTSLTDVGGGIFKLQFDFAAYTLTGGVKYWIGVSGNGFEGAQASVSTPGDGTMAQFSGSVFSFHTGVGDQMFSLEGDVVPEPATMLALGAGLAALARRKRK